MKYTLFFLVLFSADFARGQDTLFYKNGTVKAVQIFDVDESLKIIGYIFESDTLYIGKAALNSFSLHSDIQDNISFNTEMSHTQTIPVNRNNSKKAHKVSKYEHGEFSFGLNIFSLTPNIKHLSFTVVSPNSTINAYGEYSLNSHLGIGLNLRFGLGSDPENAIYYNGYQEIPIRLTIFETGIQPTIYFRKQEARTTIYCRPGFYLGKNYSAIWHKYYDYFEFNNEYYESSHILEMITHFYYRFGATLGIQFDLMKSISLGIDMGAFVGNWSMTETIYYENTFNNQNYEQKGTSKNRALGLGPQFSINLIYRLGSKIRE